MSCIFKQLKNEQSSNNLEQRSCSSLDYRKISGRSSVVSASELSYLTAQVWTLENRLKEETRSTLNLSESYQSIANEKYELLQELTCQKQLCLQIFEELQHERENNAVLMTEIECLQGEVDKNRAILEKAMTQNIKLKESLIEANETITQMGLKYFKLIGSTLDLS